MRTILVLDMSYTLKMFKERHLEQALNSRNLGGYFDRVISVHPLAGLFESGNEKFGAPNITKLDDDHVFIEGKIGLSRILRFIPPLNLILALTGMILLLKRMASETKIDVVRVGDPYILGLMGYIIARLLRTPLTIRVNGNYDWIRENTGHAVFPRLFKFIFIEKLIERFVFKRCDLIAAPNNNNLNYAIKNGGEPKKSVVFRYGNLIHPMHFTDPTKREHDIQIMHKIGLKRKYLITITRLEVIKQPDHILLALKQLQKIGHDVDFVFVGDGSMRASLEKMSEELGLSEHVIFAGNRSQEWIAALLPHAQLVLSPHMGRALTEACLSGTPIVAYDLDWQGEIIHSGVTGELVPAGDWEEMARRSAYLLSNPSFSSSLGKNARETALEMMDPVRLMDIEVEAYNNLFKKTVN